MDGTLVISVSGVRGVVGHGLTPELAASFAAAHGALRRAATGRSAIVVGRDSRVSGPMLVAAVEAGLRSVGCDVHHVGMACTPTILLAVERLTAAGGIAVTASHNPAEWNALKMASERGIFLTFDEGQAVREMVERGAIPRVGWDALGEIGEDSDATADHVAAVLADSLVDIDAVRDRGFRVVLDTCAGAGALPTVPLLDALGVQVDGLHLEPTGRFPRDPEPTAAHLAELADRVRATGADLGFAIDPDGDRLALVDGAGQIVGEDLTLALAADYVLSRRPGPVVTNLSTSQVVERVAERHGVSLRRTSVGEVNVALAMLDEGSPIGGEGNGGVIYPAIHATRDAPIGIALLLSYLARVDRSLAEAVERLPTYAIVKTKVSLAAVDGDALIDRAVRHFSGAEIDRTDGVRFAWPAEERWVHVRKSGTEPIVRLIAEAPESAAAEAMVAEIGALADR